MNRRRSPRSPEETARRTENTRAKAAQLAAAGRPLAPSRKTSRASRAAKVAPAAERVLAAVGVFIVGVLVTIRRGLLGIELEPPPAQPKPRRVEAPSWLAVVRAMPCSVCGVGRSFRDSLLAVASLGWKGVAQSEPNHHPTRGSAGGGSDLETHPACRTCHRFITEGSAIWGRLPTTTKELDTLVADTLLAVVRAIRDGYLSPSVLIAAGVEAIVGD